MAKNKRRRLDSKPSSRSHPAKQLLRTQKPYPPSVVTSGSKSKSKSQKVPPQRKPTIPFYPTDNILLVGEGDFSFARSLLLHHRSRFNSLCATCFDSREELLAKYARTEAYISNLVSPPENLPPSSPTDHISEAEAEAEAEDNSSYPPPLLPSPSSDSLIATTPRKPIVTIHYSIDATKLSTYKPLRTQPWDRIIFNFPHVGGLSTDVNRQVRANQALLHSFFQACVPLLARPSGTVLVTLFDGMPYELWNIRDLGRSAGLRVVRSWRFEAGIWDGYEHARTIGDVRGKASGRLAAEGQSVEEKRPGSWRGEEREARTYEFGLKEVEGAVGGAMKRKRKRKEEQGNSGSSSDEEED